MSGVLRRGSLSFNCNIDGQKSRGNIESNLYGGYRDQKPQTPEISIIAMDFRRHSDDLKKEQQNPTDKDLSLDVDSDEISNLIGHFGKWQMIWTLLLSLFQLPPTLHMFSFVFQTADKEFWCADPAMNLTHNWTNYTAPRDGCLMPALNGGEGNWTACTQYGFSTAHGDAKTLVEEFGLVCERARLLSVVEMCFLAGAAVGSVSSGWISDRFGRKITLMGFAFIQALFGAVLAFSTSLAMYMTLRVIIGFASMTVTVVSFVLVVELVSGRWRTIIGILNILPVALTYVMTAGLAYIIRDWRWLQLAITLPGAILLGNWYCMPESPRWLLARGHLAELYELIERASSWNGRTLPPNYRKTLEAVAPTDAQPTKTEARAAKLDIEAIKVTNGTSSQAAKEEVHEVMKEASVEATTTAAETAVMGGEAGELPPPPIDADNPLKVVFGPAYWRTTCLTLVVWLTLIIIYFGLTLHLSNLGGNIFVNTAIAGSVEAISICVSLFVVLKLGIRRNLIAYMLIPGICCLATNLVPAGDANLATVIALAMIAKCVIGANNAIIPTYTAMQYPTVVRNFGVGMGNLAAGVGLILVPYMWLLEHYDPLLPMSIMGIAGLIGALALLLMKDVQQQ